MTIKTPSLAAALVLLPFHFQGQLTATRTAAATIKLPCGLRVHGVSACARASGGTSPTLTVNVKDDGTSILSSAVSVTAGTVSEATLDSTKQNIADESVVTIDLTIGGTSPTWDDVDVLLTCSRID